jgi:hypothetical protein
MYEVRGFYGRWEAVYPAVKSKKEAEKLLEEFKRACPWNRFTLKEVIKEV